MILGDDLLLLYLFLYLGRLLLLLLVGLFFSSYLLVFFILKNIVKFINYVLRIFMMKEERILPIGIYDGNNFWFKSRNGGVIFCKFLLIGLN